MRRLSCVPEPDPRLMTARQAAQLALVLTLPLWLASCTNKIFPPRDVTDPAQVGVLDHGRHASLVVEVADGSILRYAYGDWDWYALQQTGPFEASAALLWQSQAALGRKQLPGPFSPATVAQEVRPPFEDAVYLVVSARDVQRLVDRLDRIFRENSSMQVYNAAYDLVFVPHPDGYSLFHNSNAMVADWLEQIGCRVEGPALFSRWELGAERS